LGDPHSPVGLERHQSLALQQPERLAERCATDTELAGQLQLAHDPTRFQRTAQDRRA